jgi:hypothetical protein
MNRKPAESHVKMVKHRLFHTYCSSDWGSGMIKKRGQVDGACFYKKD